ncbi:unnamed protein product [Sphacelaria rigidula]
MLDVAGKKCDSEDCSTRPSCGVAGSKRAEFCSEHARAGMVGVANKRCGYEGCSKRAIDAKQNVDESKFCGRHASANNTATVSDTTTLNIWEGTPGPSLTAGDGKSVADVQRGKRKRAAFSGSVANDNDGVHRGVYAGLRQDVRMTLPSGHLPSMAEGKVLLGARPGTRMKVELAMPPPTHGGDGVREYREHAAPSSGWSSSRVDGGFMVRGGVSTGLLCGPLAVIPGCLGTCSVVDFEEAEENPNPKLELEMSTSFPRTSGTR